MFSRLKLLPGLTVALLLLTQCEKSELPELPKPGTTTESTAFTSSCGAPVNGNTILELIADPVDPVNHRINQIMYHYGQALRIVLQNPAHLCYLEEQLLTDSDGVGISFVTLATANTAFGQALNTSLRQSILAHNIYPRGSEPNIEALAASTSWDANAYLKSKMVYPPYDHDPVAYFVNPISECLPGIPPVILLAQEVDDCDDVPGWNGASEILMSEAAVASSPRPVIFIGPGRTVYPAGTNSLVVGRPDRLPPVAAEDRASCHVDVDLHQIKNGSHFDSDDKSEVCGMMIFYAATNMTPNGIVWGYWEDFDKTDRKIHKNDISNSTLFTDDRDAFTIPASIFDTEVSVVHLFAYEHDWYASKKYDAASSNCLSPSGLQFFGRRKFQQDTYFMTCGYGSLMFLQNGSTFNFENDRCRFQFKRLN